MCLMCGEPGFAHTFQIINRPSHRLTGRTWSGTFDEATAGALHPLFAEMKELSARSSDTWKSPIVGFTWLDRPGGFRYFAGIETSDEAAADGFEKLDVPAMYCAGLWHGPDAGRVAESYAKLMSDLSEAGIERDESFCDQREEYSADIDLSKPPALRLMLPVRPDGV
jgi:predicted transcriptional regulator YdeE